MPVSLTTTSTCESTRSSRDLDLAAAIGELHGVRQQIPEDLLQPFRIAGDRRGLRIEDRLDANALGVGRRRDGVDGASDDLGKVDRLHVQPDLSRDDAGDVEHVLDDLRQRRRVALDGLDRPCLAVGAIDAGPQHAGVAEDRVQRRPQLVRQAREKVVLQPTGLLRRSCTGSHSRARRRPTTRCRRRAVRDAR